MADLLPPPAPPADAAPRSPAGPGAGDAAEAERTLERMIAALQAERAGGPEAPAGPARQSPREALAALRSELLAPPADAAGDGDGPDLSDPFGGAGDLSALPVDDFEPPSAPAAAEAEADGAPLRSTLAEMFELDLGRLPEPADGAEDEPAEEEPVPVESVAEESAGPVEESVTPEAETVVNLPESSGSVEESVDDYMAQLLARMRAGRGEADPPPAPKTPPAPEPAAPAPAPAAPVAEAPTVAPPADVPAAPPAEPAAPIEPLAALPRRSPAEKERLREEMRQLRAIANTSARSAVLEASWRRTRTRLVMQVSMCGASLALGLTLIVTSVWGAAVHYGLGGAGCFAAVWLARDFGRTLDLLRRQKKAATEAAREEAAQTSGGGRRDRRAALDVPAADAGAAG